MLFFAKRQTMLSLMLSRCTYKISCPILKKRTCHCQPTRYHHKLYILQLYILPLTSLPKFFFTLTLFRLPIIWSMIVCKYLVSVCSIPRCQILNYPITCSKGDQVLQKVQKVSHKRPCPSKRVRHFVLFAFQQILPTVQKVFLPTFHDIISIGWFHELSIFWLQ